MKKNLIYIFLALITLPIIIYISNIVQQIISKAAPKPGNIVIDTSKTSGKINNSWVAFSQGGEEPPPMLKQTVSKMKLVSPKLIRLDHIYDYYNIIQKKENGYIYDFSKLDDTVNDIISMGAIPFFCLSYMPAYFTPSGSVIDIPKNWQDWEYLVKLTIEHYSGKNRKNLSGVYYEVWNEPELVQFGNFKLNSEKDYRLMYFHAAAGATQAQNVNSFYIGGPAIGSYYKNWIDGFLSFVSQNKLRLDFLSWHRYTKNPNLFAADAASIRNDLSAYPRYSQIPIIMS
jgi:hypothetical protein